MPLRKGKSKAIIGGNISEMEAAGHPHKQAVAAALRKSDESGYKNPTKVKESHYTKRHKEHR